jgi:hypothetical protein
VPKLHKNCAQIPDLKRVASSKSAGASFSFQPEQASCYLIIESKHDYMSFQT